MVKFKRKSRKVAGREQKRLLQECMLEGGLEKVRTVKVDWEEKPQSCSKSTVSSLSNVQQGCRQSNETLLCKRLEGRLQNACSKEA